MNLKIVKLTNLLLFWGGCAKEQNGGIILLLLLICNLSNTNFPNDQKHNTNDYITCNLQINALNCFKVVVTNFIEYLCNLLIKN